MESEGIYIFEDAKEFVKFIIQLEKEYEERNNNH